MYQVFYNYIITFLTLECTESSLKGSDKMSGKDDGIVGINYYTTYRVK